MGSLWLFTVVYQMMVMPEFSTKEKNRFLWSVILWQLKVLQREKGRERDTVSVGEKERGKEGEGGREEERETDRLTGM